MNIVHGLLHALGIAASMTWQVTWSLILGFTLSAIIEALVRKSTVARLLPDDRPKSLATATVLGAASSSCSYAAVALARSLFRKGANFTSAMAFQFASTNLVIELGLILGLLLGWQFTAAEFVGGPVMIIILALLFRRLLSQRLVEQARQQADKAVAGSMEGHAAMDMSIQSKGSFWRRLVSRDGFTCVSHNFVMAWAAVLRDIVIGLLIAGAAAAWIPDSFWQQLFFTDHPLAAKIWGPLIGPLVAIASLRLLDRQRAASGGAVEWRHQLRRRHLIHLRRLDHSADPGHLRPSITVGGWPASWPARSTSPWSRPATSSSWSSARCT